MDVISVPVTALYAGLNALIMLGLACMIVPQRYRYRVGLGHGDNPRLLQSIRAHGNNTEYVPMALILIGALELMAAPVLLLHALGVALTLGRILHPIGLYASSATSIGRTLGNLLTWGMMATGALASLYFSLAV